MLSVAQLEAMGKDELIELLRGSQSTSAKTEDVKTEGTSHNEAPGVASTAIGDGNRDAGDAAVNGDSTDTLIETMAQTPTPFPLAQVTPVDVQSPTPSLLSTQRYTAPDLEPAVQSQAPSGSATLPATSSPTSSPRCYTAPVWQDSIVAVGQKWLVVVDEDDGLPDTQPVDRQVEITDVTCDSHCFRPSVSFRFVEEPNTTEEDQPLTRLLKQAPEMTDVEKNDDGDCIRRASKQVEEEDVDEQAQVEDDEGISTDAYALAECEKSSSEEESDAALMARFASMDHVRDDADADSLAVEPTDGDQQDLQELLSDVPHPEPEDQSKAQ